MSLPSSYSNILQDLNRDVIRSQPTDVLQFCASWFNGRLEAERSVARAGKDEAMRDTTPPLSARSLPGDPRSGQSATHEKKPSEPAFVSQGYTFGGPRANGADMDVEQQQAPPVPESGPTPFSQSNFAPPTSTAPSPFSRASDRTSAASQAAGREANGSGPESPTRTSTRAPPTPLNLGPRDSPTGQKKAASAGDDSDSDSDVEDPRDDPNYNPRAGPGGTSIPLGYNLGRRTSVSAESLDPNAPTVILSKTIIPKSPNQRARIEASISNNLLFRNLDEDQHKDVLNAMKEVTVPQGTEVIVQGAVGDFFYVVEEGAFEVWVRGPPTHTYAGPGQTAVTTPGEEKKVASYGPGGSFGELALMYNAPRAATVVATSTATMWALDRVTFRSILMEHTSRKRKMYESFLSEVPILASLNTKERAKIADALEEKVYDEGESVVVEGEVGKNFYIIESGRAEVSRRRRTSTSSHDEEILGNLTKGDYFGGAFRFPSFEYSIPDVD